MASSTADLVLGKIVSILENEALLLSGVRDEINKIRLELNSMKSFLEDAERKGVQSSTENAWVSSVRDMAYEAEDIIDKFMYSVNRQQQQRGNNKYTGFFLKGIQYPKDLWLRHKVAGMLQDINQRLKSIPERNQRYGVYQLEGKDSSVYDLNWLKNQSESALFFKDDDLVGFNREKNELLGWLTNEEPQRTVISVVGMGGLGKTTLVANVFNNQIVKRHFQYCAWITVSQQYAIEELLRSLIKEISKKASEDISMNSLNTMSYRELVHTLVNYLQSKRYLVVLDDVWSIRLWKEISVALPDGLSGSRIMLTTRVNEVASFEFGVVNYSLPLKPLSYEEAWRLFCMRAFPSNFGQCLQYLHSLATNLVEKCGGLPLALVALGGLMSSKKLIADWEYVLKNLNWELSNNPELEAVKCISLLSYHHLPYRLKHCFLYCCLFPEDYLIKRNRLIRLWMAEGFVETVKGATPEVVAERYLMELISRGLLQVITRNASGRPRMCKMHDILRELAVSISEREKFVAKSDGKEALLETTCNEIRRLSIEAKDKEMNAGKGMSQLRSLFVFAADDVPNSSFNGLPSGFKLLRVLDLEDMPINQLPDELVKLFNLRYLNLTRTQVKVLPKSIGELYNLQSLLLGLTRIAELPPGIVKLKNLRHLIVYHYRDKNVNLYAPWVCVRLPSNISLMKSLQSLNFIEAGDTLIRELSKMTQLRKLGIANVKEANERDLCLSIGKLSQLRYLFVMSCSEEEPLKMDSLISPPPYLEKLLLVGKLEKFPHWFNSLSTLKNLRLHWSRLREDFLPRMQALPNLGQLTLVNAYQGEQLFFREGFQKLKVLRICLAPQLKQIVINEGVMPGLEELEITDCPHLMTLPHGWENLSDLVQVYVKNVSDRIIKQMCGAGITGTSTIRAIELSRVEVEESQFEWWYKTWR